MLANVIDDQETEELAFQSSQVRDERWVVGHLSGAAIVAVGADAILVIELSKRFAFSSHESVLVQVEQPDLLQVRKARKRLVGEIRKRDCNRFQ